MATSNKPKQMHASAASNEASQDLASSQVALNINLHARQSSAYRSPATEILYGGAAGGGKSYVMRAIAVLMASAVPGLQVYLFRRTFSELYKNHMQGSGSFIEILAPWIQNALVKINYSSNQIKFWNGSIIHLCHLQHKKDLSNYQGAEIHVLLPDELTHFSEDEYRYLRNRVRLGGLNIPDALKNKLPLIIAGSNPGGIGHNWVKRTWIDAAPALSVWQTAVSDGGMLRQFIPARVEDNPTLLNNDPGYLARLEGLGNAALVKAMRYGDWNMVAGGALDDVWSSKLILPRFKIPHSWRLDRSFDWGSTHPFSVGWWAQADGTEATLANGQTFCPPAASLIRIHEWYGSHSDARGVPTGKGLKLSPLEIAKGIKAAEATLKREGWISAKVNKGPADNQIAQVIRSDIDSIEQAFAKQGIYWSASDKSPGSRINGLELLRARMKESQKELPEDPCIYFMQHCRAAIRTLPSLPRAEHTPDDVDTHAEDHVYDEVRYRVLSSKRASMNIDMGMVN